MASRVPAGLVSIKDLTPKLTGWTTRGRVTNKSEIRHYENDDGAGVRFFFDLRDESGEIRATVFNEHCDQFYNQIEVSRVYYITQSIVRESEWLFNPLDHNHEIIFDNRTQVQLCETVTNIPTQRFKFKKISEVGKIDPGRLIDVIGICKSKSDITTANGSNKRDVQIVDDSQKEILVTLWEFQAERFDGTQDSVIAIKGAKVSNYRGKSLSVATSQIVEIDPEIYEACDLITWYQNGGRNLKTENLSKNE